MRAILSGMNRHDTVHDLEQQRQAAPGPVKQPLWPFLLVAVLCHAVIVAGLVRLTSGDRVQTVVMVDLIAGHGGETASSLSAGQTSDTQSAIGVQQTNERKHDPQADQGQDVHGDTRPDPLGSVPVSAERSASSTTAQPAAPAVVPGPDSARANVAQEQGQEDAHEVRPEPDTLPSLPEAAQLQSIEQGAAMEIRSSSPGRATPDRPPRAASPALTDRLESRPRREMPESHQPRVTKADRLSDVSPKSEIRQIQTGPAVVPETAAVSAAGSQTGLSAGEGAQAQTQAAGLTQAAVGLHNPPPVYPARARRQGVQGTVLLRLLITSAGRVQEADVVTSSGHRELDDAALDAVDLWRFKPALKLGVAIDQWIEVPVVFRLK